MLKLEKNGIVISFNEQSGALGVGTVGGNFFATVEKDENYSVSNARIEGDKILFEVSRPEVMPQEVQLGEAVPDENTVVFAEYFVQENPVCACLVLGGNAFFKTNFNYPPAFDVEADDTHILPSNEGIALGADDMNCNMTFPYTFKFYGCGTSTMSMWGILKKGRRGAGLLCAIEQSQDSGIILNRDDDNLLRARPFFEPQKSYWGYKRAIRFAPFEQGGLNSLCKTYRILAEQKGLVRTLKQKAQAVKNVDRMIGAADVWIFNDDAMYKLYNKDAKATVPTKEQYQKRIEIAKDMKARGIDKVMWSIFDENVDPDCVKKVKDLGFLTTVYEVFADVIQRPLRTLMTETRYKRCASRLECWPDSIAIREDGQLMNAWQLMGKDGRYYFQSRMCDKEAPKFAKKRIANLNKEINVDGWFLDVVYGTAHECYSPEHPLTRKESFDAKAQTCKVVEDMNLVCGTEVGREEALSYCVYNEGILSIDQWRSYQSGRRMCTLYYGDEVETNIKDYMLNPKYRVPLWELVYHDCMISYWYWGDSHNCCPEYMPRRDLFLNLYGLPPLFSLSAENYSKLADSIETSYKNTSPLAREVGYERMISFDYLSEDFTVQKTEFSNGVSVIVNFSDNDFKLENGDVVPANDKIILRK